MSSNPMIFFRIAWMEEYKGLTKKDKPIGGGQFVREHNTGGEVKNFLPRNNMVYGFVRVANGQSIHIEKLGVGKRDEKVGNVTVVFFAQHPYSGKSLIVGWYTNATVLRNHNNNEQHAYTNIKNAYCIPPDARKMEVPKEGGPGQSNVWYGNPGYIKKVAKYIQAFDLNKEKKNVASNKKSTARNWQADAKLRQEVEYAAMSAVEKYFTKMGALAIEYVHLEKYGWDMEAKFGKQKLLVEVKGLQGSNLNVELTHNEYSQAKNKGKQFVLCVVTNALDSKNITVHEFRYLKNSRIWISRDGIELKTEILTAARLSAK